MSGLRVLGFEGYIYTIGGFHHANMKLCNADDDGGMNEDTRKQIILCAFKKVEHK